MARGVQGRSRAAGAEGDPWTPRDSRVIMELEKAERLPQQTSSAAGRPLRIWASESEEVHFKPLVDPQILVKTRSFR